MGSHSLPLWQLLVDTGDFADRKEATSWIMAGQVYVNGEKIDKAGTKVRENAEITVSGKGSGYVGRGGLKLEGALNHFDACVTGAVVLDTGASTGGFTDCLLKNGARLVYAVDAGYGQLMGSLRADSRVVNMERTNISDIDPCDLAPPPTMATVDLSYLSLRTAVPIVMSLLAPPRVILCLVKPLFETDDTELRRIGRIDDPGVYRRVLSTLVVSFREQGYAIHGVCASPIAGNGGTREFFLFLSSDPDYAGVMQPDEWAREIERISAESGFE